MIVASYLIAQSTIEFTHEIFTNLFVNFIAIFFTIFIIERLLKLPRKRLKELFRSDIERINFNFNYFLSSTKGFEELEYDIITQKSSYKNDSFLEFIDKSNSVLAKLNAEEIETKFKASDVDDLNNFLEGIEELKVIVDKMTNNYGNIFEATELSCLLEIRQSLDWLNANLKIILGKRIDDANPIIKILSNNIVELIKKIIELYKFK